MELVIKPDPGPGEEEALRRALAELLPERGVDARSEWWHVGVRENLHGEADEADP